MAASAHLGLSTQQVARALQNFTLMGAFWSVYGPNATATGPVLSGFCLEVGLSDSQIAFLVSLTGLMGITQLLSYFLTRRAHNKRRMMVTLGCCEITLVSLAVLAGLGLAPEHRFQAIAALIVAGLAFGHAVSPAWNSWLSNLIPAEVRPTYIGRRMFIITGVGMAYLFLASHWLDFADLPTSFLVVFTAGWLGGVAGYLVAARTPYPAIPEEGPSSARRLWLPLREPSFLRLCLFLLAWATAAMFAGAFYSVYMLRYLKLSYSMVALFTNITLVTTMVGYRLWGAASQKFGSKPIIQILMLPAAIVPLLWALTDAGNYPILLPVVSILGGLCGSGISVAMSSLLYKTVPQGRDVPEYFVLWTAFNTIGAAAGPLAGGLVRGTLEGVTLAPLGVEISGLQMLFALAAALTLFPALLSLFLQESQAAAPIYVLGQFRGNLFSFAYNFALYATAREDERRASHLRALGRSRSPLAVGPLLDGMHDASATVRESAVHGLGESGLDEGLEPLVHALEDDDAQIRPAAAEALGRLGKPESVSPLIKALYDDDVRLRTSAAAALGEIGGLDARDALYHALLAGFDRRTFPSLVDASSRAGDLRVVGPALEHLHHINSPVVRMQVLNAVGRVLGEKNHFYRLRLADDLGRPLLVERMLARVVRLLRSLRLGTPEQRQAMQSLGADVARAAAADENEVVRDGCRRLASAAQEVEEAPEVVHAAARALLLYGEGSEQPPYEEAIIFLTICLTSLARHLAVPPRDTHQAP